MKRVLCMFLTAILLVGSLVSVVSASEAPTVTKYSSIEYLENGDYIITELVVDSSDSPFRVKGQETRATKQGTKTATYYNSAGTKIWSVTVDGTFSYTYGVSATATGSTATVNIFVNGATFRNKNAYTTGNTAIASGTVAYNGVSTTKSVSITCDKYGNLS